MLKIPAQLDTWRELKDGSASLKFITRELRIDEILEIRKYKGQEGKLLFDLKDIDDAELQNIDITDELNPKTEAQKLRELLWVACKYELEHKPTQQEFKDYYHVWMEKIRNAIKKNLPEDRY